MTPPPFSATTRGTLRSRRHRHDDAAGRCTLAASKSMGGGVPKAERCEGPVSPTPDGPMCARHTRELARTLATAADRAAFPATRTPTRRAPERLRFFRPATRSDAGGTHATRAGAAVLRVACPACRGVYPIAGVDAPRVCPHCHRAADLAAFGRGR